MRAGSPRPGVGGGARVVLSIAVAAAGFAGVLLTSAARLPGAGAPAAPGIAARPPGAFALPPRIDWREAPDLPSVGSPRAVRGGRIRIGQPGTMGPIRAHGLGGGTGVSLAVDSLVHETLLNLHPATLEITAGLARRFALSQDRRTYFFDLDPRARWADGTAVTAADVAATWDLAVEPALKDPVRRAFWLQYGRPCALDDHVVAVRASCSGIRSFLAFSTGLAVLPASELSRLSASRYLAEGSRWIPMGSGPYRLASASPGSGLTLARRAGSWASGERRNRAMDNFDEIEFVFCTSDELQFEKLKKGEIDVLQMMVARQWSTETDFDRVRKGWIVRQSVLTEAPRGLSGFAFNLRRPPFDDIRVRRAFAHLIDRDKLIDKLFHGEYQASHSFFPGTPCENPSNERTWYDPARAMALLEQAGWRQSSRTADGWLVRDGRVAEVELNCVSRAVERVFTVIQQDLARAGIRLALREVTHATDSRDVAAGDFTVSYRSLPGALFPSLEPFESGSTVGRPANIWGFADPRIDRLSRREAECFDLDERQRIVREADGILSAATLMAFGWYARHNRLLYWARLGTPDFVLSRHEDLPSLTRFWWVDPERSRALERAMALDEPLALAPATVDHWRVGRHEPATRSTGPVAGAPR